jgi:hypothetical protein
VVEEVFPVAVPPGVPVTVQVPEVGSPVSVTLPVGVVQSGCVATAAVGAVGGVHPTEEHTTEVTGLMLETVVVIEVLVTVFEFQLL